MIRRACAAPMPSCSRSTRNQATSSAGLATILAAAEVLDVGRLGEPQPAVLHERDAAGRQLYLQHVAVMRRAHQHRLVVQFRCRTSWASRIRAQISRACVASSWQRTEHREPRRPRGPR